MGDGIRRIESHRARVGAPQLFVRSWIPEHPRRVVLLVHGFAEHSGRYEELGAWLAGNDCATLSFDQRGHGRSGGHACHVARYADYQRDLAFVLESAREAHAGRPVHLLGHSMGGLICALFLAECSAPPASAVLSAPALGGADHAPSPFRIRAARLLRSLRPRHHVASGLEPEGLSTDRAVIDAYLADPLVRHRQMTVSLELELHAAIASVAPQKIAIPTLVLHGGDDPLCDPGVSEAFAAALSTGKFIRYPGLKHEILHEPSRGQIYREILRWFEATEESSP